MSVDSLREALAGIAPRRGTPALLCVTGASGAGKTAAVARLGEHIDRAVLPALGFDSLGVPGEAEMALGWDSGRGWQKAMTWHWVRTAKAVYCTRPLVVLEGSFDPQYAIAACAANHVRATIAVLEVDPATRAERLARRGQPELATDQMASWAGYLREQATLLGATIVDASGALDGVVDRLCAIAAQLLIDGN